MQLVDYDLAKALAAKRCLVAHFLSLMESWRCWRYAKGRGRGAQAQRPLQRPRLLANLRRGPAPLHRHRPAAPASPWARIPSIASPRPFSSSPSRRLSGRRPEARPFAETAVFGLGEMLEGAASMAELLGLLGLGQYGGIFAAEEVDLEGFGALDEADFRALGLPATARRKLLAAQIGFPSTFLRVRGLAWGELGLSFAPASIADVSWRKMR